MKILSISDTEIGFLYSPMICERFSDVDLVISCGDLPYFYIEYIMTMLNKPMYYVRGNHASRVELASSGVPRTSPWGAYDLHRKVKKDESGLLMAGMEGCVRYNLGPYQYTQNQYWLRAFTLVPGLLINKALYGRYLDILVTHASPYHVHDTDDRAHQGAKAFNWLIKVFKPTCHLHGHIHVYRQDTITQTKVDQTQVINTYGYKITEIELPGSRFKKKNNHCK